MSDRPEFARLLRRQHGVVTRMQALACGMHPAEINRQARPGGRWQRLLPAVFLTVTGTPTADQRDIAAVLYAGRGGTLTGLAALRRHGLLIKPPQRIDVLIPAGRQRQSTGFVRILQTRRPADYVAYEGAVQFVFAARAVGDAVRDLTDRGEVRALVAAAVQTRQCTIEQLRVELVEGPTRGSALFRTALAEVIQGARSRPEAELAALIRRARLPQPMLNPRLYVGARFLACPDAWWPEERVAVEVDSREWHLSPESWERTQRRQVRMGACGIVVLPFTPRRIREEPGEVIASIRATLAQRRGYSGPGAGVAIRTVPAA